jgi:hypothetical protein
MLALAREYLHAEPVMVATGMWWSFATPPNPAEQMASGQTFHYDQDALKPNSSNCSPISNANSRH